MVPFSSEVQSLLQEHQSSGKEYIITSKKDKAVATAVLSSALRNCAQQNNGILLGHSPSLDCAGMIVPGATVYCTQNDESKATKTQFAIQLCEEIRERNERATVGCHPFLAERAARRMLELQLFPELGDYDPASIGSQVSYGKSRVDYTLPSSDGASVTLIEVKNVVGADYCEGQVPSWRSEVGVYTSPLVTTDGRAYTQHAIFPHGSKKPKIGVVSDRAIKHIHELTHLHDTKDCNGKIIQSVILFIVNRSDCECFRPCHEACMLFAQVLRRAQDKGVLLLAKELVWNHGQCSAGRSLPIAFDPSVNAKDVDEQLLQQVLQFNEDGGGGQSRRVSPAKKTVPRTPVSPELSKERIRPPARKRGKRL
jgi:DNA-binding sugar fermentation-stimulating protein